MSAAPRRIGPKGSKKRDQILEAAEQVMVEDGYAAVTSRSVATRIGINAGLVHYYFPTIDDLFVAIITNRSEGALKRMAGALVSPTPLTALWRLSSDRRGVVLLEELIAASHHRIALRDQVTALAGTARAMQLEALQELLPQYGIDEKRFPASLIAAAIQGIGLLVARQEALGVSGHDAAASAVDSILEELERHRSAVQPPRIEPTAAPRKRSTAEKT